MPGRRICLLVLVILSAVSVAAEIVADAPIECDRCDDWNAPQKPFRVFGNTYYVGTAGLSSILIDGGDALMLLDGALPQSAPLIAANIRSLGFDPQAVQLIGVSHAHFDHAGGVAALQRLTGATVLTSHFGRVALELGGLTRADPLSGLGRKQTSFPKVANVSETSHGTRWSVGDVEIVGLDTPGHTPGGMSWTWKSCDAQQCLDIVYADSLTAVAAPGYRFADGMDEKVKASAALLARLECDILLVTHPEFFGMRKKLQQGAASFIEPQACEQYAERMLAMLDRRLATEAARSP